jgi:hypothetical protein
VNILMNNRRLPVKRMNPMHREALSADSPRNNQKRIQQMRVKSVLG